MIAHQSIYDAHLAGVSRSFAACIAQLTQPLRSYVSLSYLLCRVVDTLEDAPWHDLNAQRESFLWFDRAVRTAPSAAHILVFRRQIPANVPRAEHTLLDDAALLLGDLHRLPWRVRRVLQRTLLCMSFGMRRFMQRKAQQGRLQLADLGDVNRYCFIVAGIVGTLLTRLFWLTHKGMGPQGGMQTDAVHFGLLLQKVNLLKDQQQDEQEGRFLVPNREAVTASLRSHAQFASRYLLRVPPEAGAYRRVCGYSLFLAASSMPAIELAPGGKLPRAQTQQLFEHVGHLCKGNAGLRAALREAVAMLPAGAPRVSAASRTSTTLWFRQLPGYRKDLHLADALIA